MGTRTSDGKDYSKRSRLMPEKGPNVDRFLMRLKDVIIIGTAAFALIKWLYVNPMQVQNQVDQQQRILNLIFDKVERIERRTFNERGN